MNTPLITTATTAKEDCDTLVTLFNATFSGTYDTRLIKGGSEPEYIPKESNKTLAYHQIIFTRNYFASALHEIAHWCVAGDQRRLLRDYGYWYAPDGRTEQQQVEFEQVEVRPQALEWMFSKACGVVFRVSADNIESGLGASEGFKKAIVRQVHHNCTYGVNSRAKAFIEALAHYYQTTQHFEASQYCLGELR